MEQILDNLYIGSDADFDHLKISKAKAWSILRCCKEGTGGHRQTLGYVTQAAPKGASYHAVRKDNVTALNFIDPHDPNFIPYEMVLKGVEFIGERLAAGDKVLVACNRGHSRGPSTALLYMRSIGELPGNFVQSERIFRTLYPGYDPGIGMRQFARMHWDKFEEKRDGRIQQG